MTTKCYDGCVFSQEYDNGCGRLCLHREAPYYCECDRIFNTGKTPEYCPIWNRKMRMGNAIDSVPGVYKDKEDPMPLSITLVGIQKTLLDKPVIKLTKGKRNNES
jgi:hypothetical protein